MKKEHVEILGFSQKRSGISWGVDEKLMCGISMGLEKYFNGHFLWMDYKATTTYKETVNFLLLNCQKLLLLI